MKLLSALALAVFAATGMGLATAQHADLNTTAPIQPFTVQAPQGGGCDAATPGIIIHDDGQAENGYGWNATVTDGRFAELFTPAAYPANFTSVCFAWITNAGITSIDFDIVVYADDAGGGPGTELGRQSVTGNVSAIGGVPFTPTFESFDISGMALNIPSGNVFIAVEWLPGVVGAGVFMGADESLSTPVNGGYSWANAGPWGPTEVGQVNYRALTVRAVAGSAGPGAPSISKAFAPSQILVDETSTLTITLNNASQPTNAADLNADLVDTFPAGLVVAATPNAATTCGGTLTATAGSGSVTLGADASIPAASSCTVTVDVTSATNGAYANTIPAGALQTSNGNNAGPANATLTVGFTFPEPYCAWTVDQDIEPITLVDFANIDNASDPTVDGSPALEDFTPIIGNVAPGAVISMAVEGNTAGDFTTIVTTFVDWNQDFDFDDAGETYPIGEIDNSTGVDGIQAVADIAVPAGALNGQTRMRVTKRYNQAATACNTAGWGQAEDYTLNVSGGGGGDPVIQVTPNALAFTVDAGATDSEALTIANIGGGSLDFTITEAAGTAGATRPSSYLTSRWASKARLEVGFGGAAAILGQSSLPAGLQGVPVPNGVDILAQMDDNTPAALSGIACGTAGVDTAANSWWRRFYLSEHGAPASVDIASVTVATETGPSIPATINLYSIPHGTPIDTIPTASLTLIASGTGTVGGDLTTSTIPVVGTLADAVGTDLVVEYHIDGAPSPYFPGGNATPETHPSFISAADCGLGDPVTMESIGFPDAHNIIVVNLGDGGPVEGCENPSDIPWLSVAPANGSVAGGSSTDATVSVDASGLAAGDYSANVCVASNDPVTPLVTVPVALTVNAVVGEPCSAADTIFCDGFDPAASSGPGTYDNRDDFLAATAAGYFDNPFDDAVPGPIPSLSYTQGGWAYTVDTGGGVSGLYNDTGIVSTDNSGDSIVVTFTGDPVTAVGGNFWATDVSVQPTGTEVVITLSDGTTETFTSTGPADFRGFTTAAPITSIAIDAPFPDDPADNHWATMDNLIIGTGN